MSILVGPFEELESTTPEEKPEEEDDILAFGYSCKLYRDDAKALLEDSGALLIPWMGDSSLMIDRYDVRNRLEDKNQFGLKPNIPHKISTEEEQLEDMLDKERYLSLDCDILEEALREEEEDKRRRETVAGSGTFHAVGYSYADEYGEEDADDGTTQPACQHSTTSRVDTEEEMFVLPPDLVVPNCLVLPSTNKLHSIIEKTAQFVCQQGQQMEIIIKTKQKYNPFFSFLDHSDLLNPYYRHLLLAIGNKSYVPKPQVSVQADEPDNITAPSYQEQNTQQQKFENESKSDSGSDDEEGYELHPLLRGGVRVGPVPPSEDREPKSLSEGERGHSNPLYTSTMPINLAPAVSSDSHADLNPRGEVAMLDSTQMQLHGSTDMQGRGFPAGHQQYSDDPYNAYCYQMQLAEYQYNLHAYYQAMSSQGIIGNGPTPPPPDMQPIVDKTAEYVAKNEEGFERTVLDKHCDDPKFAFLNPWNQYHAYYQMKKEEFRRRRKMEELEKENALNKPNVQRLGVNGAVSFKLAIKSSKPLTPKVDLNVEEEDGGGEGEGEEEGGHRGLSDRQEDHRSEVRELAVESEPAAKKPRCSTGSEEEKIDCKVQEFLSRVKQMLNTN